MQGIKDKNLPPEKRTVSELNAMLQWYKNPNDTAAPTKKAEKLAKYYQICNQGDPLEPEIQPLPSLPPPPAPVDSSNEEEPRALQLTLLDDNGSSMSDDGDDDLLMMIITGTGDEQVSTEV